MQQGIKHLQKLTAFFTELELNVLFFNFRWYLPPL